MSRYEEENLTIRELIKRTIEEKIQDYDYKISEEDKKRLLDEIADSETFYQRLDQNIEDGMHDWMDFLGIEKIPFTDEEEKKRTAFFEKGQFIIAPEYINSPDNGPSNYLWEDFQAAAKFAEDNPDIHVYTLCESDGVGYIVKGARWVNRFAYLLSVNDAGLDENDEVRFW